MNLDWVAISKEIFRGAIDLIVIVLIGSYIVFRFGLKQEREKQKLELENEIKVQISIPRALELIDKIQKWRLEGRMVLARSHIEPAEIPILPKEEVNEIIKKWSDGQLEVLADCETLDKIIPETNIFNSLFVLVNVESMNIHSKINDFYTKFYNYLDSGESLPYQPNAKKLVDAKIDEITNKILKPK